MLGFVVRRLRGRWPLAVVALLTVLITTTVLTALFAFTRGVGEAGLRQALQDPGSRSRATVLVTGGRPVTARGQDDEAVRALARELFGRLPVGVESVARSRSYGLPGARTPGRDADLTLLAAFDHERVRLLAGRWPGVVGAPGGPAAPGPVQVAAPKTTLARLGIAESALPAEVRLDDRYGGGPFTVLVTGVYQAAEADAPYWRLDPLAGRELQVGSLTTYGPLLVDDSAFTAGGVPQNDRALLLDPDFAAATGSDAEQVLARAAGVTARFQSATPLQLRTELPALLAELQSSQTVARSTLLVGALQLAVLAAAALLLVARLSTDRQQGERALLTARGSSRRRLAALAAAESLLLALPAVVLAPLLTPPLLRLVGRFGPLARVPLDTPTSGTLWLVAACCALACVGLTTLPAVPLGTAAAVLRRTGRRQALVAGAARSGADLALVALAVLAYQQLSTYGGGAVAAGAGRGSPWGVDPVLVAAPTLAVCAGTLLVLRILPFAARLGGRIAARGRGLGPALVGWQLARRPRRATGPVLLLVLAVSSGVLALGQQTAWSASQRDQADFATAGGLRIAGSELPAMGRGGRYGTLPGGERVIPVVRARQELPGGRTGQVLALDARGVAERVPLRADLRDGRGMRALFAPLAPPSQTPASASTPSNPSNASNAADAITLPGRPQRIDVDVHVRPAGAGGRPGLGLLLRDRFGLTYRTPMLMLPESGDGVVSANIGALVGAPLGSAATPLSIAGLVFTYENDAPPGSDTPADTGAPADAAKAYDELTVRGVSVAESPGAPAVPVPVASPAPGWQLNAAPLTDGSAPAELLPGRAGAAELLRLRYRDGSHARGGVQLGLTPGAAAAPELPGIATRAYLAAVGAAVGDVVPVPLAGASLSVRITAAVGSLPVAGDTALAVDLATAGRVLAAGGGLELPAAGEWWLPATGADDPAPARAAAALRSAAGNQQVHLREEVAAALLDDPLSAGPQSALAALAVACAVLAAIGFAASAAAAGRERAREFAVLTVLGAPRRGLARSSAVEGCVLVGLATAVGLGLGALVVHLVVPLVVLTPAAARPLPSVLVDLPAGSTLLLTAAIAAVPLLSVALGGRRNRTVRNAAARLRHVEDM
ncbi:FtsX-like permease family protein [Streptomyces sp. NPDC091268]|uniref:FtsX-like permease family protein n=1 Tax=Streptomyces sp. NPDC091268 TaxID=3365979 RepID=UPI0037FE95BE